MDNFKLRNIREEDAISLAVHANNKKIWDTVRDFFPHPYTVQDAVDFARFCQTSDSVYNQTIDINGEAVGVIGIVLQSDVHRVTAEVGYWLGEKYWGKGIMTEALKSMTALAFVKYDLQRLHTGVFANNRASMRVLEKAGYTLDCVFRNAIIKNGNLMDEYRYSFLRVNYRIR